MTEIDGKTELLAVLPVWIKRLFMEHEDNLEELVMDIGSPLTLRWGDEVKEFLHAGEPVTKQDIAYVDYRLGGFRPDNRCGINGTVHRISALRDRYGTIGGVTIRLGRFREGIAEPLRPHLERYASLLIVGKPGTGKTTLIRDIVRIVAQLFPKQTVVVDTSNEIGGDGLIAHPKLGAVRRVQVPSPMQQANTLMQAVGNLSPRVVIVDEIGVYGDVPVITTMGVRGIEMIASAHGSGARDVLQNRVLHQVLGEYNPETGKRLTDPTFKMLLEIRGKGVYFLYPDLSALIDAFGRGDNLEALGSYIGTNRPVERTIRMAA